MSTIILAQQLRVGDKIDRGHSKPAEVVSATPIGGRIRVVTLYPLTYRPNDPVTVYRDPKEGEAT